MSLYSIFTMPNFASLFLASLIVFSCSSFTLCSASESETDDETPFTYVEGTGKGPKEWGKIDSHWRSCDGGKLQSPINLLDQRVQVSANLGKLERDYKPAPAVVKNRGHDISVRWIGDAGEISINGTDYKLIQCHWHSPSEHTFNGSRYELELHIVHLSSNGGIAVIAIVYEYGHPDRFLSRLFHHIKTVGEKEKYLGIVNPGDIKFGSRKYYRYIGSLTVPPCTEGVIWTVIKKVRTASREQVRALRDAVHDGFEANARPTQASVGIPVSFYTPREH
ncbi:putative Alpha carbonic anhydrase 4 [Tripterygium wilfordii]|uniref:Putative Alpha carbonic anhydrase 4 n=1 Tax=Tripterygium wilfordii TaxID=458696 RepID=A0A7J7DV59_TRIWF|nr:alpha carbonic anhydrase 4-like [Tripterygium wilfordii]KAF5750248.1 putative Alpha carbonic anhydrase 4 [Tripterygium wilfordii]